MAPTSKTGGGEEFWARKSNFQNGPCREVGYATRCLSLKFCDVLLDCPLSFGCIVVIISGHALPEVRERALDNIRFKLEHGLLTLADLMHQPHFLRHLVHWFQFSSCSRCVVLAWHSLAICLLADSALIYLSCILSRTRELDILNLLSQCCVQSEGTIPHLSHFIIFLILSVPLPISLSHFWSVCPGNVCVN